MNTPIETLGKNFIAKFPNVVLILLIGGFVWMFQRLDDIENDDILKLRMNDIRIEAKLDNLTEDVNEMKQEIKEMRNDITDMKSSIARIEALLLKKSP